MPHPARSLLTAMSASCCSRHITPVSCRRLQALDNSGRFREHLTVDYDKSAQEHVRCKTLWPLFIFLFWNTRRSVRDDIRLGCRLSDSRPYVR